MPNLKKIFLLGSVSLVSLLYAYEPSVYGAGNMESATPYGLTQTEQAVLDNKKNLQKLFNKIDEQQRKIDGLTTIIEGQNREILELKEQIATAPSQAVDNNETYILLYDMGQMIDKINNSYVTKDELKKALAGSRLSSNRSSSTGGNSADTYRKGVQLFSKRSYRAANEYFLKTLAAQYKPASSNYYLGEIAYYTQKYNDAVAYYKKSASLYDKASYIDVLYLHTAISLDKSGKRDQAQGFYQYVIDNYPNKKSASIAKNRI